MFHHKLKFEIHEKIYHYNETYTGKIYLEAVSETWVRTKLQVVVKVNV